jgi:hypothetical protein
MLSVHFYEASHNSTVRGFDAHGVNSEIAHARRHSADELKDSVGARLVHCGDEETK